MALTGLEVLSPGTQFTGGAYCCGGAAAHHAALHSRRYLAQWGSLPSIMKRILLASVVLLPLTAQAQTYGNPSYVATGSNAPRGVASRFGEVVNVEDFGARCNGTTDDTTAFQAAFAAATNASLHPRGAQVQIPAGTCVTSATISATLTSTGDFAIRGRGKAVSIIKVVSATDGIDLSISHASTATLGGNVELSDFAIYTTAAVTPGIAGIKLTGTGSGGVGDGPSYSVIKDVQIGGTAAVGQYFYNGIDIEQLASVKIDRVMVNVLFNQAPWAGNGILINGGDASHPYAGYDITGVRIGGMYAAGIRMTNDLQGIDIDRPYITGTQDGIDWITTVNGATLNVHSGIINVSDYGVHTSGVIGVSISGDTQIFPVFTPVVSVQWYGVYLDLTGQSSVIGAQVGNFGHKTGFTSNGIYLFDNNDVAGDIIADNKMSLLTGFGIQVNALPSASNPFPIMVHGNNVALTANPFSNLASPGQVIDQDNCFTTTQACVNTGSTQNIQWGASGTFGGSVISSAGQVTAGTIATQNSVRISGAATGSPGVVQTLGIDANIALSLQPKGNQPVLLGTPKTVSTLGACTSALAGGRLSVTDATTPTLGAALAGGGTVFSGALCNGTAWVAG